MPFQKTGEFTVWGIFIMTQLDAMISDNWFGMCGVVMCVVVYVWQRCLREKAERSWAAVSAAFTQKLSGEMLNRIRKDIVIEDGLPVSTLNVEEIEALLKTFSRAENFDASFVSFNPARPDRETARFNPFVGQCADMEQALAKEKARRQEIASLITSLGSYFGSADVKAFTETRDIACVELNRELYGLQARQDALQNEHDIVLKQCETQTATKNDPVGQCHYNASLAVREWLREEMAKRLRVIDVLKKAVTVFQNLDYAGILRKLEDSDVKVAGLESEFEHASRLKNKVAEAQRDVYEALEKTRRELDGIETKRERVEIKRDRAQEVERELANASTPEEKYRVYEKNGWGREMERPWQVRQACEREIEAFSRQQESLARTRDKLEERLCEIAEKMSRDIRTLIIDGNNLLYDNKNNLIGDAPLQALVSEFLSSNSYRVRVFFDPGVQRILGRRIREIESLFGENVEVVIAPPGTKADQMILAEADADSKTYVITCDRFHDYPDRQTVKDGRLLAHRVMEGSIHVPELGIRASFARSKETQSQTGQNR